MRTYTAIRRIWINLLINSWDCTETVWDNWMAYEDGVLFSCDNEDDRWNYYNCSDMTYGDSSMEEMLK